ncbi:hypothetical protein J500_0809 [Acinetobacter sp. 479375]|nr:hypothetical protein J500_0809 [Acinetobacter sp. 479375]
MGGDHSFDDDHRFGWVNCEHIAGMQKAGCFLGKGHPIQLRDI